MKLNNPNFHLILGGRRSGKSQYAEELALKSKLKLVYIATASKTCDKEMQARILEHQARRDNSWRTIEEPLDLAGAIEAINCANTCILVDCLTLWLTNILCSSTHSKQVDLYAKRLIDAIVKSPCKIIIISNEVGSGIVPLGALSRSFCDNCGILHQQLAAIAANVTVVIAGLPLVLKQES